MISLKKILNESVNEGKLTDTWRKNNKKGYILKVGDIQLKSEGPSKTHTIYKNGYIWGKFHMDYESGGIDWWVEPDKGNDFYVKTIDDIVKRVEADSRFKESINENFDVKDGKVISNGKLIGYYDFDRGSDSFWVDDVKDGKGQISFDTKKEVSDYFKKNERDALKHLGKLRGKYESVTEASLQKGKTYGGTKCEGGCFMGKEGLKKIIKISKDSPKDVFMFRQDNFSGLQPHFIKDGVIAKATVINPAYDLEKYKVRSLNIGKDVILSVRLFVSTNESVNEGSLYSSQQLIKKLTPKIEKDVEVLKKQFPKYNISLNKNRYEGDGSYTLSISGKNTSDVDNKNIQKVIASKIKESVTEAKSDYEVYHKSYTSAIQAARAYAEKKGYEINDDDAFTKIGMGPRKPSEGKTNRFDIELSKDGKVQRKKLQIQVYGMKNSYELNAYIQ